MFKNYYKYDWVYRVVEYSEKDDLSRCFNGLTDEVENFFGKIKYPKNKEGEIKPINIKELPLSKAKR
jgi:hypothetical protein